VGLVLLLRACIACCGGGAPQLLPPLAAAPWGVPSCAGRCSAARELEGTGEAKLKAWWRPLHLSSAAKSCCCVPCARAAGPCAPAI
jgi:hypothetical protein